MDKLKSAFKYVGLFKYTNEDIRRIHGLSENSGIGPYRRKYDDYRKAWISGWLIVIIILGLPLLIYPLEWVDAKFSEGFRNTPNVIVKYLKVVLFLICKFFDVTNNDITLNSNLIRLIFKVVSYILSGSIGYYVAKFKS